MSDAPRDEDGDGKKDGTPSDMSVGSIHSTPSSLRNRQLSKNEKAAARRLYETWLTQAIGAVMSSHFHDRDDKPRAHTQVMLRVKKSFENAVASKKHSASILNYIGTTLIGWQRIEYREGDPQPQRPHPYINQTTDYNGYTYSRIVKKLWNEDYQPPRPTADAAPDDGGEAAAAPVAPAPAAAPPPAPAPAPAAAPPPAPAAAAAPPTRRREPAEVWDPDHPAYMSFPSMAERARWEDRNEIGVLEGGRILPLPVPTRVRRQADREHRANLERLRAQFLGGKRRKPVKRAHEPTPAVQYYRENFRLIARNRSARGGGRITRSTKLPNGQTEPPEPPDLRVAERRVRGGRKKIVVQPEKEKEEEEEPRRKKTKKNTPTPSSSATPPPTPPPPTVAPVAKAPAPAASPEEEARPVVADTSALRVFKADTEESEEEREEEEEERTQELTPEEERANFRFTAGSDVALSIVDRLEWLHRNNPTPLTYVAKIFALLLTEWQWNDQREIVRHTNDFLHRALYNAEEDAENHHAWVYSWRDMREAGILRDDRMDIPAIIRGDAGIYMNDLDVAIRGFRFLFYEDNSLVQIRTTTRARERLEEFDRLVRGNHFVTGVMKNPITVAMTDVMRTWYDRWVRYHEQTGMTHLNIDVLVQDGTIQGTAQQLPQWADPVADNFFLMNPIWAHDVLVYYLTMQYPHELPAFVDGSPDPEAEDAWYRTWMSDKLYQAIHDVDIPVREETVSPEERKEEDPVEPTADPAELLPDYEEVYPDEEEEPKEEDATSSTTKVVAEGTYVDPRHPAAVYDAPPGSTGHTDVSTPDLLNPYVQDQLELYQAPPSYRSSSEDDDEDEEGTQPSEHIIASSPSLPLTVHSSPPITVDSSSPPITVDSSSSSLGRGDGSSGSSATLIAPTPPPPAASPEPVVAAVEPPRRAPVPPPEEVIEINDSPTDDGPVWRPSDGWAEEPGRSEEGREHIETLKLRLGMARDAPFRAFIQTRADVFEWFAQNAFADSTVPLNRYIVAINEKLGYAPSMEDVQAVARALLRSRAHDPNAIRSIWNVYNDYALLRAPGQPVPILRYDDGVPVRPEYIEEYASAYRGFNPWVSPPTTTPPTPTPTSTTPAPVDSAPVAKPMAVAPPVVSTAVSPQVPPAPKPVARTAAPPSAPALAPQPVAAPPSPAPAPKPVAAPPSPAPTPKPVATPPSSAPAPKPVAAPPSSAPAPPPTAPPPAPQRPPRQPPPQPQPVRQPPPASVAAPPGPTTPLDVPVYDEDNDGRWVDPPSSVAPHIINPGLAFRERVARPIRDAMNQVRLRADQLRQNIARHGFFNEIPLRPGRPQLTARYSALRDEEEDARRMPPPAPRPPRHYSSGDDDVLDITGPPAPPRPPGAAPAPSASSSSSSSSSSEDGGAPARVGPRGRRAYRVTGRYRGLHHLRRERRYARQKRINEYNKYIFDKSDLPFDDSDSD